MMFVYFRCFLNTICVLLWSYQPLGSILKFDLVTIPGQVFILEELFLLSVGLYFLPIDSAPSCVSLSRNSGLVRMYSHRWAIDCFHFEKIAFVLLIFLRKIQTKMLQTISDSNQLHDVVIPKLLNLSGYSLNRISYFYNLLWINRRTIKIKRHIKNSSGMHLLQILHTSLKKCLYIPLYPLQPEVLQLPI